MTETTAEVENQIRLAVETLVECEVDQARRVIQRDLSTNIGEETIYIAQGEVIKHGLGGPRARDETKPA
jgi:hypothetical protein